MYISIYLYLYLTRYVDIYIYTYLMSSTGKHRRAPSMNSWLHSLYV